MNWWQCLMHEWVRVLQQAFDEIGGTPLQSYQFWGPGIDGDVSVTGAVTLARDMFYENLTFEPGGSIETHGHRVFVRDTMDLSRAEASAIWFDASQWASPTIYGVLGAPLTATAAVTGVGGVSGGAGGNGGGEFSATGGGANGTAGTVMYRTQFDPIDLIASPFSQIYAGMPGSPGGDGGPSSNGGDGGHGGAGGGMLWISAQKIRRDLGSTPFGCIKAVGQAGYDGADSATAHRGGGGGGGGGCGGAVFIRSHTLLGTGVVGAVEVSGGNGGEGGAGLGNTYVSNGGSGGSAGVVYYWNVGSGTFTALTSATSPGAASGVTGGTGVILRGDL